MYSYCIYLARAQIEFLPAYNPSPEEQENPQVCFAALQYTSMHFTALEYTKLHCDALHCKAKHCTKLHVTALHCVQVYADNVRSLLASHLGVPLCPLSFSQAKLDNSKKTQ